MAAIPSLEERAIKIASDLHRDAWINNEVKQNNKDKKDDDLNHIFELLSNYAKAFNESSELRKEAAELCLKIEKILVPNITIDVLRTKNNKLRMQAITRQRINKNAK